MAVSTHIVILYSPIGGHEHFKRIKCFCLQGWSQMSEEVGHVIQTG